MDKPKSQKKPILVVKKKKRKIAAPGRGSVGLPSFKATARVSESSLETDLSRSAQNGLDQFLDEIEDEEDAFPSEASIAIDVLTTSRPDLGLLIPLKGALSIYGVMECQIQEFFRSKKIGSSQSLSQELDMLVQTAKIVVLSTPNEFTSTTSIAVYVKISDYFMGVRVAIKEDFPIISDWFCDTIATIGRPKVSREDFTNLWDGYCKSSRQSSLQSADTVLRMLQDRQILLAVQSQSKFQLSLPNWGSLVLPAFQKASKDTLTFIKQSRYGERSVASLEKRLGHCPIPVSSLLVPWMVSQGLIQRESKPSGLFVSLPKT